MSAKNAIIARIREALREPAPVPGHHQEIQDTRSRPCGACFFYCWKK